MKCEFFKILKIVFLSVFLLGLTNSVAASALNNEPQQLYLQKQLKLITSFSNLQENDESHSLAPIMKFIDLQASFATSTDDSNAETISEFVKFAFSAEENEKSNRVLWALQAAGRIDFHASSRNEETTDAIERPFTHHVKEAIKVNKDRAKYYKQISNGKTATLSKLYTSLEYALLPISRLFDLWAKKFWKAGIPVLKNDFVSMGNIKQAGADLERTNTLDADGQKLFKQFLKNFQFEVFKAAAKKDFLQVQLAALRGLHLLKVLETKHSCNLTLSIHFIESIGLAARNADALRQQFKGEADNFYRAFIISQAAGIRFFSKIDLKAQNFHRQSIGIIANDLPAIPFP
ncbi:MAG: hypothetical protein PWR01_4140 [Clostridiales bacterium]|jgi:hypothetical protein|nr:hypothetical protein [Clostridiales bacterium]MDN5283067.1 hypothetical protein [Candidatus Ozemobacter sp.]